MTLRKRKSFVWNWKCKSREISSRSFFLSRNIYVLPACKDWIFSFNQSFQQLINMSKRQSSMNQFCNIMNQPLFRKMIYMILLWHLSSFIMNVEWDDFHGKMDSLTWDTNEWLISGWLHQLPVPHPGEHVPLCPLRLHLPDHNHHHREVASGLLPLLIPGGLQISNVSFFSTYHSTLITFHLSLLKR